MISISQLFFWYPERCPHCPLLLVQLLEHGSDGHVTDLLPLLSRTVLLFMKAEVKLPFVSYSLPPPTSLVTEQLPLSIFLVPIFTFSFWPFHFVYFPLTFEYLDNIY